MGIRLEGCHVVLVLMREAFKFIDQNHYERLADAVADYIQETMVKDYNMIRMELPFEEHLSDIKEDSDEENAASVHCPIFVSSNYEEVDVILVLLCGTGRVASGQWARKLCINDSLKTGSVLPFLDWAMEHSFGVIVLNPNKNFVETEGSRRVIPLNECAEAHVNYAWKAVCKSLPANHFVLVAHSYGGVSTCNLLEHQGEEVLKRLRCIAFTDSAHSWRLTEVLPEEAKEFLATHCINWASSSKPLDTILDTPGSRERESGSGKKKRKENSFFEQLRTRGSICMVVSAGTDVHEETTMSAYPSICKFLLDNLQSAGAVVDLRMDV
eukprot:c21981_g1_i2 orf=208-1185(+)